MSGVSIVFADDYKEKSKQVTDERVFKIVARKFAFLRDVGLSYPSLNAKELHNVWHEGVPVWEFYISKKWRCLFICDRDLREIKVLRVCNHI